MRNSILMLLALIIAGVVACNSNETLLSQNPAPAGKAPTPATSPVDNARRITAAEFHKLWEKNEVTVIDTRTESAFKQEHIKGAMLIPAGTILTKLGEIPRNKMIVTYCT